MIRILQVGMVYNLGGGIQTFLMNYYKNVDRKKIQFDFINIYGDKFYYKDEIEELGGKVYSLTSYYKNPFKYLIEMKKVIKENNYNIVHCNMNSAVFLWPLIAAKLAGAKVVIAHSHNASSDKGIAKSFLHYVNKHFIPLFANVYFACSKKAGEWFYSKRILKSNKFFVINNAVNTEKFKFDEKARKKVRKDLKIDDNTLVLCHVGRFTRQKNHYFLIDAFKKIHELNKNTKLLLIGTGQLYDEICNYVHTQGLNECISILGQRKDVSEIMSASDIFVLPSLYEGLPLVGVEAQSSGLKCYISDTVTSELKVLDDVEYLPLTIDEWSKISSYKNKKDRKDSYLLCKDFDIKECASNLYNLYKKIGGLDE